MLNVKLGRANEFFTLPSSLFTSFISERDH